MAKAKPLPKAFEEADPLDVFIGALRAVVDYATPSWSQQNHLFDVVRSYTRTTPLLSEQVAKIEPRWRQTRIVTIEPKYPIYLPPLEADTSFMPLLICSWDFREGGQDPDQRSLRLKMVREWSPTDGDDERRVRIASVHLDSANPREWNYFHLQLTQRPTPHFAEIYGADAEWLPAELPRIPLPASSPSELLLCLLVGLYGFQHGVVDAALRAVVKRDPCAMMMRVVTTANT